MSNSVTGIPSEFPRDFGPGPAKRTTTFLASFEDSIHIESQEITSALPGHVPIERQVSVSAKFSAKQSLAAIKSRMLKLVEEQEQTIDVIASAPSAVSATMSAAVASASSSSGSPLMAAMLPLAAYSTYSLVKNWKILSWTEKALQIVINLGQYICTARGISLALTKVAPIAKLLSPVAIAGAGQAILFLGPIGAGIFAVIDAMKGVRKAFQAKALTKKLDAAQKAASQCPENTSAKLVMKWISSKLSADRKLAILDSLRSCLIAIGLGFGGIITAGVIAGAVISPLGWAAAGALLLGFVIGVGILAYKRFKENKLPLRTEKPLVESLVSSLIPITDVQMDALSTKDSKQLELAKISLADRLHHILIQGTPRVLPKEQYTEYLMDLLGEPGKPSKIIDAVVEKILNPTGE